MRDEQNNYRKWKTPDLFELGDIMFYRNLSVPIKELRLMPNMTVDEIRQVLQRSEQKLLSDIDKAQHSLDRIYHRLEAIDRVKKLSEPAIFYTKLPAVYPVVYESTESMKARLDNPYSEVAIASGDSPYSLWGATLTARNYEMLRPADTEDRLYMNCLLLLEYQNERNQNTFEHNLKTLYETAEEKGYACGDVIGTYLLSAFEKYRCTYYDCYIELFPKSDDYPPLSRASGIPDKSIFE